MIGGSREEWFNGSVKITSKYHDSQQELLDIQLALRNAQEVVVDFHYRCWTTVKRT